MKSTGSVPLGPWIKGIQNVNDPAMTPDGCVVEADNVFISSDGSVTPRSGYDLVAAGGHSLFRHNGRTYGVFNRRICEFFDSGARTLSNIDIEGRVTWGVLNDCPVFVNTMVLGHIVGETAKRIGVEAPVVRSSGSATLTEDSMAVSFVSDTGEEGPLSPIFSGGTISPPAEATVVRMRTYKPQVSQVAETSYAQESKSVGDTLYLVSETAVNSNGEFDSSVQITAPIGRPAETMNKARMPGGNYVRYWRGRLLVARGRTLFFSDPLRYGLYDRAGGFVTFEARIDFIEPVEGGVYVALRDMGVHFLAGETPEKWERKVATIIPAQASASVLVPTAQMSLDLKIKPEWVAVWFTHKGFAVGLPSGDVLYPQADLLSGLPLGTGSLHFEGDRLIALSQ